MMILNLDGINKITLFAPRGIEQPLNILEMRSVPFIGGENYTNNFLLFLKLYSSICC